MIVSQDDENLSFKRVYIVEWGDDRVVNEELNLEGIEMKSVLWNSPRVSKANWSEKPGSMVINSKVTFTRGHNTIEIKSSETWDLLKEGKELSIFQKSTGFLGEEVKVNLRETIKI